MSAKAVVSRTLTAEQAKALRARLPEVEDLIDSTLAELAGEPRKLALARAARQAGARAVP